MIPLAGDRTAGRGALKQPRGTLELINDSDPVSVVFLLDAVKVDVLFKLILTLINTWNHPKKKTIQYVIFFFSEVCDLLINLVFFSKPE